FGFVILVFLNSSISIIQELNAKHTIDKLSLISAPKVKVLRNGEETEIMVKDIVLDDITILSSGGQICADSVVVEGCIEVNESLITGEPDAIVKNVGDEIMSGSFVVSGKARAKVIHVGMDNFAMKISAGAKYFKKPSSDILRSLNKVVKVMAILIVPLGISLFCIKYLLQAGGLNVTVINTIGTLIGMIPSGLVALSSAVFCISVIRLAKHKTLAQDMYCVETLARVDVLCLDKTGTITEGTMEVNSISPKAGGDENEIKQILKNFTEALAENNATANAIGDYVKDCASNASTTEIVPFSS
ncbi:MAG: HAD-IC family P-type ATPase, partial [Clostridia bacterium]